MLAVRVRSGLEETYHEGAVAISEPNGTVVAFSGDIDRPFFLRSSAKPFQAYISQSSGAKGGALACIGIGLASGIGVAVKSWDGVYPAADVGAVAALEAMGLVPTAASTHLEPVGRPVMLGGGKPVGHMEPGLELTIS